MTSTVPDRTVLQNFVHAISKPGSADQITAVLLAVAGATYVVQRRVENRVRRLPDDPLAPKAKQRVQVDKRFWRRLRKILSICIPGIGSREFVYLAILTAQLMARTYISVRITYLAGLNGQNLAARNWPGLLRGMLEFFIMGFPAAIINSSRKYVLAMLSLCMRIRLSQYVLGEYLKGVNFYKAASLGGENQLDTPDQRVTADIDTFTSEIGELYCEILKPLVDVVVFTRKLRQQLGVRSPVYLTLYFILTAVIQRRVMPGLGRRVAKLSQLEGMYRVSHTRLVTNSEEIAFYDGSAKERTIIEDGLRRVETHVMETLERKFWLEGLVQLFTKYWASVAGLLAVGIPLIGDKAARQTTSEITRDFILNSQYLGQLKNAGADLVGTGMKLTAIAGHTHRIWELVERIQYWNNEGNRAFNVSLDTAEKDNEYTETRSLREWLREWQQRCDAQYQRRLHIRHNVERDVSTTVGGGKYVLSDSIIFDGVDIVSPDGQLLVKNLRFKVEPGVNVMVTGPNGAGKSSLFRVIGELWPLQCGTLHKPKREDVLFVPQKPYLVLGTLRDQIIYPHSKEDMQSLGITDDDLANLLATVDPRQSIVGTWKWDDVRDWFLTLSGGQKQRVAMARVFYHKPKFAVLDECTSAVSAEVESTIYQTAKDLGITIFTVSHRASLQRHHDFVLALDGRGHWTWSEVSRAEDNEH
eukprot:TRINITY_DN95737_c0_g1_i1.p1 TRINITY_DN95737_c0_g1~~TRINITY_DN95737_c0_g1_i1.p1  ORF type:complete len:698 (+),score=116.21 TRINITY_DN95737_c0_g1_i1:47-2140(+)